MRTGSRALRNAGALSGSQMLTQLISVAYGIALSRYAGPAGFGRLGAAIAVTAVAYVFADLGLTTLTIRDVARAEHPGSYYATNVTLIKLLLLVPINVGLGAFMAAAHYGPQQVALVWLYSGNAALASLLGVRSAILQGREDIHLVAAIQMGRDLLNVGLSIVGILLGWSLPALVGISIFATFVQLTAYLVVSRRRDAVFSLAQASPQAVQQLVRGAMVFGAFLVITTVYSQLSVVLVSVMLGETQTGYYTVALAMASLVALVPSAASQSLFPVFSRFNAREPAKLADAYADSYRLLCVAGFGSAVVALLCVRPAVGLVDHCLRPVQLRAKFLALVPRRTARRIGRHLGRTALMRR